MFLHEAIEVILKDQPNVKASTRLIADEIATRDLYKRKDGSRAKASQINARVRCYPQLFTFADPGIVQLVRNSRGEEYNKSE